MKKRIIALLLLCTMLFAVTACGDKKDSKQEEERTETVNEEEKTETVNEEERTGTVTYDMPAGFTEVAEGQWVSPDYASGDTSNIIVQAIENDPYGINYTEDEFIEIVTFAYEAQGYSVENMNMIEFTKSELNGFGTLLIDVEYTLTFVMEGTPVSADIQQIEFLAQIGNVTHAFTYTSAPQFGWYDAFRDSVESIEIK